MLKAIESLRDSNLGIVKNAPKEAHRSLNAILDIIQEEVDKDYRAKAKKSPRYCRGCQKKLDKGATGAYCRECILLRSRSRICAKCGIKKRLSAFEGDSDICWACELLGEK